MIELRSAELSYYYGKEEEDHKKIILPIKIEDSQIGIKKEIYFKFDTGAVDIATTANSLGIRQTEEEFVSTHDVIKTYRVGVARDVHIAYYRYIVENLQLAKFNLHNFPIYITFYKGTNARLIGMSLIRLFKTCINPEYKSIQLTETNELANYTHTSRSMHNIDKIIPETLIDFSLEGIDESIIEANYINKLT